MGEMILNFIWFLGESILFILFCFIVATPVILIISLFRKKSYIKNVKIYYKVVIEMLKKLM